MNLPTKLTVSRIVMALLVIFILLFPFYTVGIEFPRYVVGGVYVKLEYIIAGVLFILASITDALDGNIARKRNLVSDTGKMLDAIADKILVDSILIILASQDVISVIIPVVVIIRDIVVDALKMEAASKGKVVAAIMSGKIKTTFLMVGVALTLFDNLPFEMWNLYVSDFCLYFACVMSIISMIEYYNMCKKFFKEEPEVLKI